MASSSSKNAQNCLSPADNQMGVIINGSSESDNINQRDNNAQKANVYMSPSDLLEPTLVIHEEQVEQTEEVEPSQATKAPKKTLIHIKTCKIDTNRANRRGQRATAKRRGKF